jgi:hypothetical protein
MFIFRNDTVHLHSLTELQSLLQSNGVNCSIEEFELGPWLVLEGEGERTAMSMTVDQDGTVSSAMIQFGDDSSEHISTLLEIFRQIGWNVDGDGF